MNKQENATQRIYFKNLDILRFMAAYMVVLLHAYFGWKSHFGKTEFIEGWSVSAVNILERCLENFTIGVDMFFLISGFLLTYLLLAEHEKTGKVDIVRFYIRRAFRIWPLYFFMLLLGPVMTYFFAEQAPGYLYHFFFAGNFDLMHNGTKSIATDHLWSICIEEHYYLICPLMIAFIPPKRLPEVLIGIVVFSIFFRGYLSNHYSDVSNMIYVHTLSRIDVLALGSLAGYLHYHNKLVFNHQLSFRLMVYAVFILVFMNVTYNQADNFFFATIKKYFFVFGAGYWMGNFLFNKNAVLPVQKTNILHTMGKVTYGLYMFNPVVIYLILKMFSKYEISSYPFFIVLLHVSLVVFCFLSYRFFEMPFLKLKEKYAVVKSGGVVSAPAPEPIIVAETIPVTAVTAAEPVTQLPQNENITQGPAI